MPQLLPAKPLCVVPQQGHKDADEAERQRFAAPVKTADAEGQEGKRDFVVTEEAHHDGAKGETIKEYLPPVERLDGADIPVLRRKRTCALIRNFVRSKRMSVASARNSCSLDSLN
jgi:hypothetical protein